MIKDPDGFIEPLYYTTKQIQEITGLKIHFIRNFLNEKFGSVSGKRKVHRRYLKLFFKQVDKTKMNVSKKTFNEFFNSYFLSEQPKALFPREVREHFEHFRNWHVRNRHAPAQGASLKLFTKWIKETGIIVTTKKRK